MEDHLLRLKEPFSYMAWLCTMPPQTESSRMTGDRQLQSAPYAGEHSCAYT